MKNGGRLISLSSGKISLVLNDCLTPQQKSNNELCSMIQTVLFDYMIKQYASTKIENPTQQGVCFIIPKDLTEDFPYEFYDVVAHELSQWCLQNTASKDGLAKALSEIVANSKNKSSTGSNAASSSSSTPQVKLYKNLFKDGAKFSQSPESVGRGQTKPYWVKHPGHHKNQSTGIVPQKKFLRKESSFTADLIRRIKTDPSEMNILFLLRQGSSYLCKNNCTQIQYSNAYKKGDYTGFDEASQAFMKRVIPLINNREQDYLSFYKAFSPLIHKERVFAGIAGIYVRFFIGPKAPKIKFLNQANNPDVHLNLLSGFIEDAKDFVEVNNADREEELTRYAHKIVEAAFVRRWLGCEGFENKPDNYMFKLSEQGSFVIPIDTDWCLVKSPHDVARIAFGKEGAKELFPLLSERQTDVVGKQFWDNLFSKSDNSAVEKSMLESCERAALILTKPFFDYVYDYIKKQNNGLFELSDEDRQHVESFFKYSQSIALKKLTERKIVPNPKNLVTLCPWLRDIIQEVEKFSTAANNNNNNSNNNANNVALLN